MNSVAHAKQIHIVGVKTPPTKFAIDFAINSKCPIERKNENEDDIL